MKAATSHTSSTRGSGRNLEEQNKVKVADYQSDQGLQQKKRKAQDVAFKNTLAWPGGI